MAGLMASNILNTGSSSEYTMILFNAQSIDDADTLLFAESHISEKCIDLFSKLVADVSNSGVKVRIYVEGSPAEGNLKYPEPFYKREFCIEGFKNDENISLAGWSPIHSAELTLDCTDAVDAEMALKALQGEENFLIKKADSIEKLIESKMGTPLPINRKEEEMSAYFMKIVNFDDTNRKCMLDNVQELAQVYSQQAEVRNQIRIAEVKCLVCGNRLDDIVVREIPLSTIAMTSTLQKLRSQRKSNEFIGKAVYKAGAHHLRTSEKNRGKPEYDLTLLYNELRNHRAIILIPHCLG